MPDLHIVTLMINTRNPEKLADFWSSFLGVPIEDRYEDEYIWLGATKPGAPRIAFQRAEDPTDGTRRLHADFVVPNLDDAIELAESLGGSRVDEHSIGDFVWQVMRDPEGNEFCVSAG